jgi:polysaccharide biosynthesis protein PslH
MSQGRRLLFITPVMPAETGNGLAMRAGMFLEALAADHEISLLVVPVAGPADPAAIPEFVARRARRVVVLAGQDRVDPLFVLLARVKDPAERARALQAYPRPLMCRFATGDNVAEAGRRFAGLRFDVVHVFRLYMAPFAAPFLASAQPRSVLDLDEDEPSTWRRLGALHALRGQREAAALEACEAEKYARLEPDWLPRFDRVLVAGEPDRVSLGERLDPARIETIPNATRLPVPAAPRHDGAGGFLFVGSLGYFPNEDAALFFIEDIWPRLAAEAGQSLRASIVGSRPSAAVLRLARDPRITVTGQVPSVTPYYAEARVVVNPIRAGGGMRIKAIEAFAHGLPLVSTSIGAEGLEVEHGRHLLIADTAGDFAVACQRLVQDPALASALAARGHALYRERYALPRVGTRIQALYQALASAGSCG